MTMKSILNEWRKFSLNEGNAGLYRMMGMPEGTIDVFLGHFVGNSQDAEVYNWTKQKLSEFDVDAEIQRAKSEIPELTRYEDETIKKRLMDGWTVWWDKVIGEDPATELVEFKVSAWEKDMKDQINAGNRGAITEMMFFVDYLDDFFDNEVKTMGGRGEVEFTSRKSGLHGQMQDWYLGSEGGVFYDFLSAMEAAVARLDSWRKDPEVRKGWDWLKKK